MSYLKPQVSFSLNFSSLLNVMKNESLLSFSSWNFIRLLQRYPTKGQNFRLLTAQVEFHHICTLIGSFSWKYIKFKLKRYRIMSHDTEEWCKIWRKTNFLFQNWQEFGEFDPSTKKSKKLTPWLVLLVKSI